MIPLLMARRRRLGVAVEPPLPPAGESVTQRDGTLITQRDETQITVRET
jgi:hypothetical protein